MFKFISLKTKIVIFILLSFLGVYIILDTAFQNTRTDKGLSNIIEKQKINEDQGISSLITDKEPESEKAIIDEIAQQDKSNSGQVLEVKYNIAKDAFLLDKNYDEAIKLCNEMIEEDPGNYKAYNLKGIVICYQDISSGSGYNRGMLYIDKALEIEPDFGYSRFNKALAYELFGYYEEALVWYNKALDIEDYVWTYYGIASIYGRKGDVENTVKYLKLAIEKDAAVKKEAASESDFDNVKDSKEFQSLIYK